MLPRPVSIKGLGNFRDTNVRAPDFFLAPFSPHRRARPRPPPGRARRVCQERSNGGLAAVHCATSGVNSGPRATFPSRQRRGFARAIIGSGVLPPPGAWACAARLYGHSRPGRCRAGAVRGTPIAPICAGQDMGGLAFPSRILPGRPSFPSSVGLPPLRRP